MLLVAIFYEPQYHFSVRKFPALLDRSFVSYSRGIYFYNTNTKLSLYLISKISKSFLLYSDLPYYWAYVFRNYWSSISDFQWNFWNGKRLKVSEVCSGDNQVELRADSWLHCQMGASKNWPRLLYISLCKLKSNRWLSNMQNYRYDIMILK